MEPIRMGMTGAAVEDVQDRLASMDYQVDEQERASQTYGESTAACVAAFRSAFGLGTGNEVDEHTWATLVDESHVLGDRTLYLRLPNFHGRDVRDLQLALNVLGFSCGAVDGYFGAHTESALKRFQESVGILPDGMGFSDTIDAIWRLHHVWQGKPAEGPHPTGDMGFARAAKVLESTPLSIAAEDPISRNVAGRIWNLASATSDASRLSLAEHADDVRDEDACVLVLATADNEPSSGAHNVVVEGGDAASLAKQVRTAWRSAREGTPVVRVELPGTSAYDGSFTSREAQSLAVLLLDAICLAFSE